MEHGGRAYQIQRPTSGRSTQDAVLFGAKDGPTKQESLLMECYLDL